MKNIIILLAIICIGGCTGKDSPLEGKWSGSESGVHIAIEFSGNTMIRNNRSIPVKYNKNGVGVIVSTDDGNVHQFLIINDDAIAMVNAMPNKDIVLHRQ